MVPAKRMGSGPPLLVLNGYAATKDDWDPTFLDELATGHDLIVVDNPGMGEHAMDEVPGTIAAFAESAATALDEAGVETTDVLGWSMGGFIAQELAAAQPGRVEQLVLLSTDPGGLESVRAEPDVWAELESHEGTPEEQARRLLGLILPAEFAGGLGSDVVDIVAAARSGLSPQALDAQERAMDAWHTEPSEERLAAIKAPTLIACGSDDQVIPAANSALLAEALEGSWLAPFAGGGHAFQAQEPKRLATLVGAFLNGATE